MNPQQIILGFIIIEIAVGLGIIITIYIVYNSTEKKKRKKQKKNLKKLQKTNQNNIQQIKKLENKTDLKKELETSKDIEIKIKELLEQKKLIKDKSSIEDITKNIEICSKIIKNEQESNKNRLKKIPELKKKLNKIIDSIDGMDEDIHMIEEQKIVVKIQENIMEATKALENNKTKEFQEKTNTADTNIEKCQTLIKEKIELKNQMNQWEDRIQTLLDGWDKVEPEMIQEIPEKYQEYILKKYYKKHKDEPIILEKTGTTIRSLKSQWNEYQNLEQQYHDILETKKSLENNFDMTEENKLSNKITDTISYMGKAIKLKQINDFNTKMEKTHKDIEKLETTIKEKQEINNKWPQWEQRITTLLDGWDKVDSEMMQEIPEQYHEFIIKKYYQKHKDEPIILEKSGTTITGIKSQWDEYRKLEQRYYDIVEIKRSLENSFDMKEENKLSTRISDTISYMGKAIKLKQIDDFNTKMEKTRADIEKLEILIRKKEEINNKWPEWEQRITTLLDGWDKANSKMLPEIPKKWLEYSLKRYFETHKDEPILYKKHEIITPPKSKKKSPKEKATPTIETNNKLSQGESKFYNYLISNEGEYSRTEAATELGLDVDKILKMEENLRKKDYIE